jgi:hypothetical protein
VNVKLVWLFELYLLVLQNNGVSITHLLDINIDADMHFTHSALEAAGQCDHNRTLAKMYFCVHIWCERAL